MIGRYGPPVFQILRGLKGAYNVVLMKAKPKEGLIRDYLFYFLKQQSLFNLIDSLSQRTAGQSGVDMSTLKNYPFYLPPLETQKRIVALLDRAQALIDKRQRQIALMDQLIRSLFYDMFGDPVRNPMGWKKIPFQEICSSRLGKMLDKKRQTGRHLKAYIRNANVKWFTIDLSDISYLERGNVRMLLSESYT